MLLLLVVLGLNQSNEGVNQLSMENRLPVLSVKLDDQKIRTVYMGEAYDINTAELYNSLKEKTTSIGRQMKKYF
ncbi:MAG: hypothetical protein LBK69_08275 [Syntrophomonadaceae bacterium]|jgi:hypothetical protein|nr:hypothetical protein [Syntrophomonadaceae bacterium]